MNHRILPIEQKNTTYGLALNIFRQIWFAQQKEMGGSASAKNFSADDPIFMLERVDKKIVASATSEICMSSQALDRILDLFTEYYWDKIECIIELYAVTIGKECKNLDENDILHAFQFFVNMFVDGNVKLLMQSQSVPEIIGVVDEHRAYKDFKPHTVANYDRIDFERKWYHTRTQIGTPLSLEVLAEGESAEGPLVTADVVESELKMLIKEFLLKRDKIDRKIYRMREKGMTYKDIAEALGYKTHSAVTKRLKKMKNEMKMYPIEYRT